MTAYDIAIEWIKQQALNEGLYYIDTEYDGMEIIGEESEPMTDLDWSSEQPRS